MAGVGLVDAGVHDRRPVVLQHRTRIVVDRGRDDVDTMDGPVELIRTIKTEPGDGPYRVRIRTLEGTRA